MDRRRYDIHLLGGFALNIGEQPVEVSQSVQRLLAFLALSPRALPRHYVAETLWPDAAQDRAGATLRTTLWRLRAQRLELVQANQGDLGLRPEIWVDARSLDRAAEEFRRSGRLPDPGDLLGLRGELLPGHWDSWLVFDRERLRHEAMYLLESACEACLRRGEAPLAALLGLGAVECDPLRESATLLMIKAHLAMGDAAGAIRRARRYAQLLSDELGIAPSELLDERLLRPSVPVGARPSMREQATRTMGVAG